MKTFLSAPYKKEVGNWARFPCSIFAHSYSRYKCKYVQTYAKMCNHVQKVFRRREGSFDIPVKADIFPDQAVDGRFPLAADGGNVHVQKLGGLGVCPARIVQGQKNDLRLRVHCQDRFVYVFNLALSFFQGVGRSLCSGGPALDRVGHLYQKAVRVGGRLERGVSYRTPRG